MQYPLQQEILMDTVLSLLKNSTAKLLRLKMSGQVTVN